MSRQRGRRSRSDQRWPGREPRLRPVRDSLLIVCEGARTEWNYFEMLKKQVAKNSKYAIKVIRGRGSSRMKIMEHAVKEATGARLTSGENETKAYCVMDTESLSTQDALIDMREVLELAGEHDITPVLSNPAFEVWYLAHFKRTAQTFSNCDAVISELNRHWQREFGKKYSKSDARILEKLVEKTGHAIKHARGVLEHDHEEKNSVIDCNSSTHVFRLVEEILGSASSEQT